MRETAPGDTWPRTDETDPCRQVWRGARCARGVAAKPLYCAQLRGSLNCLRIECPLKFTVSHDTKAVKDTKSWFAEASVETMFNGELRDKAQMSPRAP